MNVIDLSSLATHVPPIRARASWPRSEHLAGRVLIVASVALAVAMTAFICTTTHLLG